MIVNENAPLERYNTFRINYRAEKIVHTETENELIILTKQLQRSKPFMVLGGGSNLLFTEDYRGTLIHPVIGGINVESSSGGSVIVSAGAGLNWDSFVEWTVKNELYGLENLSLIPGNVGASPVQNIGAYGAEIRETIEKVETIRLSDGEKTVFNNEECGFAYRYSIFKGPEKGKYAVTRVFFRLGRKPSFNLDYGSVKHEVLEIGEINLHNIRQAVINIRKSKLPDPQELGNAGSFFKNPVVDAAMVDKLKSEFPFIPVYPERTGFFKIAAGWLIEQCGFKGTRTGDAGIHEKQALVLVNYGSASGKEIYELSEMVRISVMKRFGIDLEREVEIVGAI